MAFLMKLLIFIVLPFALIYTIVMSVAHFRRQEKERQREHELEIEREKTRQTENISKHL